MNSALQDKSREDAEQVLAGIVAELLPSPVAARNANASLTRDPLTSRVLREIEKKLKITIDGSSPRQMAKVFDFLSREMKELVLSSADLSEIKVRLGQRGDLRPDLYEIRFRRTFTIAEKLGVRRSHVEEALRRPHMYQHMGNLISDAEDSISLYLRTNNQPHDPFSLLVMTRRKGNVQEVGSSVWRLYHNDFDLTGATELLDLLKAF